jgi:oxygen-dependent protoporphyrinogen oxidase
VTHVAVVGGGVSGLAAAWFLRQGHEPPAVTLVEAGDRLGGKIRTSSFAGRAVDEGADAFLARGAPAVELCRKLGLGDRLTTPATDRAFVWTRGALRPLPAGLVLGVPTGLLALARSGILSPAGVARAALDLVLPPRRWPGDRAVGDVVTARLGRELHQRLVEPVVGGINAARTDRLSIEAAAPQLAAAARRHRSLLLGLRAQRRAGPAAAPGAAGSPVFLRVAGGMAGLVERLADGLGGSGVALRLGRAAVALERAGGRYLVHVGDGATVEADAVVLALPAFAAAPLVAGVSPGAARLLASIGHASVALVTLAYPREAPRRPLDGSGFLVPPVDGRLLTACSWMSSKWAELADPDLVILRASVGRWGDERAVELDDRELVEGAHAELDQAVGLRAGPLESRVTRWPRAFPQYEPGHLERVATVETTLAEDAPGVAVAGASYRGVGIPACVEGAAAAARRLGEWLARRDGRKK